MSKHRLSSIVAFLVIFIAAADVRAQEVKDVEEEHGDVVTLAEKPKLQLWDGSADVVYLPSSDLRGSADDLSMTEFRAGFGRRFPVSSRLELSGGLRYSLRAIDAPDSARLPETLHAVSAAFGAEYRTSESLTVGLRVSPGVNSDFKALSGDDVRVPVSLNVRYQKSKTLTLLGGVVITGGSHANPVIPIVGALYMPSDGWVIALGFPRTGVMYRTAQGVEWYGGIESARGEYHLHDPRVGAEIISYRDFRGGVGVDCPIHPAVKIGVAGGYAFARRFVFYDGDRDDVRLDSVPFGKVQVKIAW